MANKHVKICLPSSITNHYRKSKLQIFHFIPIRMDSEKEKKKRREKKKEKFARMWINWKPCALLMIM